MKKFILGVILFGSVCMAGAKITLEDGYYLNAGKVPAPTIGLGIWQKIYGPWAYSMWTGVGWQPRAYEQDVRWVTSKHEVLYYWGKLYAGVGYAYKHAQQPMHPKPGLDLLLQVDEHKVYGKLGLTLW